MTLNVRRIEGRMKEMDITQEQLANKMGVSARTVFTILSSGRLPKDKYLPKIAEVLDVTEDWLLQTESGNVSVTGHGNAFGSRNVKTIMNTSDAELIRLETENRMLREQMEMMKEQLNDAKKLIDKLLNK